MNRWNIPGWLEREVVERDRNCIYCGVQFVPLNEVRKFKPSWEHIVNDARIVSPENIAICCISCNASKGTKHLAEWLNSNFCKTRGITKESIAEIARRALANPPIFEAGA